MSNFSTVPFTESYMEALASRIERDYIKTGRSMERLAIVFGGKRPEYFLKRALAQRTRTAFIAPTFFTIDAFMSEVSGTARTQQMSMELEDCYEIYNLVAGRFPTLLTGRATFARFLAWSRDILNFIAELDIEDIGPECLKKVAASARIGYPVPSEINALLGQVLELRAAFHERLQAKGRITRALQYRQARAQVAQWSSPYEEIIFANFFYFHQTEEMVVKSLYERGVATLLFQGDQRKWPVLERVAQQFGQGIFESTSDGQKSPEPLTTRFVLKAYCSSDVHAQAAAVRDVLRGIPDQEWHQTVVVLPDPGSLVPLLSAFPEDLQDVNVSMGYSLKRSSLFLLLQAIFRAQVSRKGGAYYACDYLNLLRHPLLMNLEWLGPSALVRVLVHALEDILKGRVKSDISGKVFIALEEISAESLIVSHALSLTTDKTSGNTGKNISEILQRIHQLFFRDWEYLKTLAAFAGQLYHFLEIMRSGSAMGLYPLNMNIATRLDELCQEWRLAACATEVFLPEELFAIFESIAGKALVHFKGTPLKGLQVLGLFETRALNFKHVIVMDANEGVLPCVAVNTSLIPREVTCQLGIDRLKLDEEIQRYQFMRVISSAAHVHIVYQKNREKESSRFLEELVWEQQMREGSLRPYPTQRIVFGVNVKAPARRVVKTEKMLQLLRTFSYSASAVNAYVRNPYDFYMRYVLGVREQEDLLDEPDAALIGTFLHNYLEEVFKPFVGRRLVFDKVFEAHWQGLFKRRFAEVFERRMRSDAFMVRAVMENKLRQFFEYEQERSEDIEHLLAVEGDAAGVLTFPCGNFSFKARMDRVEKRSDGTIVVLDYKTGSSVQLPHRPLAVPSVWTRETIYEKIGSFQLPLYMHFVGAQYPGKRVDAGLYLLSEGAIHTFGNNKFTPWPLTEALQPYFEALGFVMAEICDPLTPFEDNDLSDIEG